MTKNETNIRRSTPPNGSKGSALVSSFEFRHSNFIRHSRFRQSNFKGFTLIELMISIALVLVLMLGINQIFKYTTQAVGAGEAINSAVRGSRAIQAAFAQDFAAMVSPGSGPTDAPYLIISNMQTYAYRSQKDMSSQGDYSSAPAISTTGGLGVNIPLGSPYQDFAGTGKFGDPSVNGDVTQPYTYNNRNHRIDVLSFFARDQFHRQTGNDGTFVSNMSSSEAMIWYGHANIPDNSGSYYCAPGQPLASGFNNDNNFFANQFVLARMAMLLVPPTTYSGGYYGIEDNAANKQNYVQIPSSGYDYRDPLRYASPATDGQGVQSQLNQSRYDLVGTSISTFRTQLQYYLSGVGSGNWYQQLMDGEPFTNLSGKLTSYRYACNPYVTKPMTAAGMAAAAPYFLGSCTQFTVEFAGDYMDQENNPNGEYELSNSPPSGSFWAYGTPLNGKRVNGSQPVAVNQTDGQVDYVLVKDPVTGIIRKQIIWYGLPRNTSGTAWTGAGSPGTNGDVMPVAWWFRNYINNPTVTADVQSFEKTLPQVPTAVFQNSYTYGYSSMQAGDRYICAWGPNDKLTKPKLIRITVTLDDPNGQLPDGQTYQYVFPVP